MTNDNIFLLQSERVPIGYQKFAMYWEYPNDAQNELQFACLVNLQIEILFHQNSIPKMNHMNQYVSIQVK